MRAKHSRSVLLGLALGFMLLWLPAFSSVQTGVGGLGDQGCTCHGGDSSEVTVVLSGLPVSFESNTTYNLSITVESAVPEHESSHQGGFRLIVNGEGVIAFENPTQAQQLEDGWTHEELGTYQRTWNLTWTSSETSTEPVEFIVHGNTVNGNELSSGDEWDSFGQAISHVDNPVQPEQPVFNRDIGVLDWTVFTLGLTALVFFFIRVIR